MNNSLVKMYCKCGMFDLAKQVFDGMINHDVYSWNSMFLRFAMHGSYKLAIEHLGEMTVGEGLKPDANSSKSAYNQWRTIVLDCEYFQKTAEEILESEEVAYSVVYASAARRDEVGLVRRLMTHRRVRKETSCSKNYGWKHLTDTHSEC